MIIIEDVHQDLFIHNKLTRVRLTTARQIAGNLQTELKTDRPKWWQIALKLRHRRMKRSLTMRTLEIECLERILTQYDCVIQPLYKLELEKAIALITAMLDYEMRYVFMYHIPQYDCPSKRRYEMLTRWHGTLIVLQKSLS